MSHLSAELMVETGKFRSREVRYLRGPWQRLRQELPEFELRPFKADSDEPENKFLRTVVRLPLRGTERPMAIGVVSPSYTLAPHRLVFDKCEEGLRESGIPTDGLLTEIGLSELDEWMNLRFYLPKPYQFEAVPGDIMTLRLECTNSVDGSSRLEVHLTWLRLICSNGMTIEESVIPLSAIHNVHMDIDRIPAAISKSLATVNRDQKRLIQLADSPFQEKNLAAWVDGPVSEAWGPVAAARVLHICRLGSDAELRTPFGKGKASEKEMTSLDAVPGSPAPARSLFDVSQALAWVATQRANAEERMEWQREVPRLINKLATAS